MARILHQVNLDALQNVEPARRRELWERLPGEPARAFRAFAMFRDALERRVVSEVGAKLTPPCSRQNVWRWSFRWRWEERAAAFDVEQDRVQRAEFARNRVRMRDRHVQVARAMLHVAGHALREWADRIEQRLPLHLTPEQIAILVKAATELENRTMGTEAEHKFTQIIVRLTDAEPLPDLPAPADSTSAALCGDTTGERTEDDRAYSWNNPSQEKLAN